MSATEKDMVRDMRLVQEMYARGIEFMPIDLYRAKADRFQIIDGKIMPSFASIAGMGLKAAQQLEEAKKRRHIYIKRGYPYPWKGVKDDPRCDGRTWNPRRSARDKPV